MVLVEIKMPDVKSLFLILCVFCSLQLFSMEIALHKKIDTHCWWKGVYFFAKNMVYLPKEIADIILYNSYLLRINAVYKKFDPFFLFGPEIIKFNESHPHKIKHCRKYYTIEPHDLLFFTSQQDEILSSLVSTPQYFHHDEASSPNAIKGLIYPVLRDKIFHLTPIERENYLTLPTEFIQKLDRYPMFWSSDQLINNKTSSDVQIK